tara:strand:+ start:132 stop:980 length:849 start_codon:yes stop_codon:yes gene_type:complete
MLSSPKLYCLLSLLILIVFSVLGTSDMLNFKNTLFVEGFHTSNENPNNYNARAAAVTGPEGNTYFAAQGPEGNIAYGNVDADGDATVHTVDNNQEYDARGIAITGPEGNTFYAAQGPEGNVVVGETSQNYNDYGIYYPENGIIINEDIPPNHYNYIKKTQVVPPVCPACPYPPPLPNQLDSNGQPQDLSNPNYPSPENSSNTTYNSTTQYLNQPSSSYSSSSSSTPSVDQMIEQIKKEKCPPCPACERCPEPAFECKKVPNYKSPASDNYLPMPVLNDFSSF